MFMWWLFTMLFVSFRVASLVSFGFVPELWGSVWLRPFVFFMDSFFFLAGFQTGWPYPRNHFYLCFASCLLYRYVGSTYHLFIMPPILPCQTSNHPVLTNRCFTMSPLLLSPSYSVASCRWSWSLFHVGTLDMLGYHNISYLINASIHLVKGGRLGLMPGVLFHSCCPSYCYTGIMFLEFAFLTRSGDLWDPLDSSPWIKLLQQGPNLVLPFAT